MNNTLIIRFNGEVGVGVSLVDCKKQANLDCYDFCPTDVVAVGIPTTGNFQASHSPLKTMPIPHEDDASTQNSTGEAGGGLDNTEPQKSLVSWSRHHPMSVRTLGLGVRRMKGDDAKLKEAAKREREGRCERPSGIANEQ
jgi:hypothetical protein